MPKKVWFLLLALFLCLVTYVIYGELDIPTLMNQKMEVAYEKDNIENCDLLLSRQEYKEYEIIPPREIIPLLDALIAGCSDYN